MKSFTSHPSEEILRELESSFVFLFERKREFHREKVLYTIREGEIHREILRD